MLSIWNLFIRNLANFLSFVSIGVTIFFGVFYVPSWLEDVQQQKIKNSEQRIEQTIKELIYSDTTCRYAEVEALVKAGEIDLGQNLPLSINQILIKVESSFMEDKFLRLEKRRELALELEGLRKSIPLEIKNNAVNPKAPTNILARISEIFSIVIAIAGIYGIYIRFLNEKKTQEEIINQKEEITNQKEELNFFTTSNIIAQQYEQSLISVIEAFEGVEIVKMADGSPRGFDLEFRFKRKLYYVEIKFLTKSKVGSVSLLDFMNSIKALDGEFWFIHNTDLSDTAQQRLSLFKRITNSKRVVKNLKIETADELSVLLPTLLS